MQATLPFGFSLYPHRYILLTLCLPHHSFPLAFSVGLYNCFSAYLIFGPCTIPVVCSNDKTVGFGSECSFSPCPPTFFPFCFSWESSHSWNSHSVWLIKLFNLEKDKKKKKLHFPRTALSRDKVCFQNSAGNYWDCQLKKAEGTFALVLGSTICFL